LDSLANRTIDALKASERAGKNSVIMCAGKYYAAIDPNEGYYHVAFLEPDALNRFRKWITEFRKSKFRADGNV